MAGVRRRHLGRAGGLRTPHRDPNGQDHRVDLGIGVACATTTP
ncbi:hypothetical protein [Micromonospora zamorensis]|nr:hypothetical protein OG886_14520 [Micromonospora zamorensis]